MVQNLDIGAFASDRDPVVSMPIDFGFALLPARLEGLGLRTGALAVYRRDGYALFQAEKYNVRSG